MLAFTAAVGWVLLFWGSLVYRGSSGVNRQVSVFIPGDATD